MKMFTSLEDLNKFLTEELGIAAAVAQAGPDADEAAVSFSFEIPEQEAGEAPESVIDEDAFNSYVEFSSTQITRLTNERDDARKLVNLERQAHLQCHEHMQEHIHQIRVQGYAEALAAGLFPGIPFETLTPEHQEVLMRQAHAGIERVDQSRADIAAHAAKAQGASVH